MVNVSRIWTTFPRWIAGLRKYQRDFSVPRPASFLNESEESKACGPGTAPTRWVKVADEPAIQSSQPLVLIPAGMPRKPGMTCVNLFESMVVSPGRSSTLVRKSDPKWWKL